MGATIDRCVGAGVLGGSLGFGPKRGWLLILASLPTCSVSSSTQSESSPLLPAPLFAGLQNGNSFRLISIGNVVPSFPPSIYSGKQSPKRQR